MPDERPAPKRATVRVSADLLLEALHLPRSLRVTEARAIAIAPPWAPHEIELIVEGDALPHGENTMMPIFRREECGCVSLVDLNVRPKED